MNYIIIYEVHLRSDFLQIPLPLSTKKAPRASDEAQKEDVELSQCCDRRADPMGFLTKDWSRKSRTTMF